MFFFPYDFLPFWTSKAVTSQAVSTVSALLCIAAIGGLATMSTANTGCKFGAWAAQVSSDDIYIIYIYIYHVYYIHIYHISYIMIFI